jgi:hypothetical protein
LKSSSPIKSAVPSELSFEDELELAIQLSKEDTHTKAKSSHSKVDIIRSQEKAVSVNYKSSMEQANSSLSSAHNHKLKANIPQPPEADMSFEDALEIAIQLSKEELASPSTKHYTPDHNVYSDDDGDNSSEDNSNYYSNDNESQNQLISHDTIDLELDKAIAMSLAENDRVLAEQEVFNALNRSSWTCRICQYENIDSINSVSTNCSVCNYLRSDEWSCNKCLFDNDVTELQCSMCGNSNPNAQAVTKSVSNSIRQQVRTKCGLSGCALPSTYYGFCSVNHHQTAVDRNMLAPTSPNVELVLVGPSGDFTAHLLIKKHRKHAQIKQFFLQNWEHPDEAMPSVQRIYWIRVSPQIYEKFRETSRKIGNVVKRFHGTSQMPNCYFGVNQSKCPCNQRECCVCSICRDSFQIREAGKNGGRRLALRYGKGLYFSPVSSKSHSYNELSRKIMSNREWRSMFVCDVAIGKTYDTTEGFLPDHMCPPSGYDSVVGHPGGAGPNSLNYPEVCVYNKDVVLPSYLIVYSLPI